MLNHSWSLAFWAPAIYPVMLFGHLCCMISSTLGKKIFFVRNWALNFYNFVLKGSRTVWAITVSTKSWKIEQSCFVKFPKNSSASKSSGNSDSSKKFLRKLFAKFFENVVIEINDDSIAYPNSLCWLKIFKKTIFGL